MTTFEETSKPAAGFDVAQRWLPALLLLFVGSGCAALIYEVVWFQLLQLSIGSSAVSLGVLRRKQVPDDAQRMARDVFEDERRTGAHEREMGGDLELGRGGRLDQLKRPPLR
jgi:hypothetical protein